MYVEGQDISVSIKVPLGSYGATKAATLDYLIGWNIAPGDTRVSKVSFGDVLEGTAKMNFRDKIVMVFLESENLKDFKAFTDPVSTSLSRRTPPSIIHLNFLNSVLTQSHIHKTSFTTNFFIMCGLGMAMYFLSSCSRGWQRLFLAAAMIGIYVAIALWLFIQFNLWIPIAQSVFVVAGVNYAVLLRPSSDPEKVVNDLFRKAGFSKVENAGQGLWRLEKDQAHQAVALLWDNKQRSMPPSLAELLSPSRSKGAITRIYLLFEETGPQAEMLHAWKQELGCEVVPLLMSLVEKASGSENCARLLKEIEEPYLTRTDPYAEF